MRQQIIFFFIYIISFSIISCDKKEKSENNEINNTSSSASTVNDTLDKGEKLDATTIAFTDLSYDFGKVKEGEKVEHTFIFKNSGKHPLIISDAKASCGCTLPEWTKDPVLPGKEGKIRVIYDSEGKEGKIAKTVNVFANTEPNQTTLNISVEVLKKDKNNGPLKN